MEDRRTYLHPQLGVLEPVEPAPPVALQPDELSDELGADRPPEQAGTIAADCSIAAMGRRRVATQIRSARATAEDVPRTSQDG